MGEIINMNKITAIAFILFATAWADTTVTFDVKKSFSWLRIVKTLNYNFVITGRGETPIVKGVSEWYIFKGYFEQLVEKTRLIKVTNVVNGVADDGQLLDAADQKDDKMILEFGYAVPSACVASKNFDLKVEENGWTDKTRELKAIYTCNDNETSEEANIRKEEEEAKARKEQEEAKARKEEEEANRDTVDEAIVNHGGPIVQEIIKNDVVAPGNKTPTVVEEEVNNGPIVEVHEEVVGGPTNQDVLAPKQNPIIDNLGPVIAQKIDDIVAKEEVHERIVV